jgi:hypothetical protein
MPAHILITFTTASMAVIVTVVLLTSADTRVMLSVVVGITGGLQTSQVGKVHYFCIAVVVWLLLGPLRERHGPVQTGVPLLLPLSVGALVLTAWTGSMVNSPTVAVQLILLAVAATAFAIFGHADDVRAALLGLLLVTTYASAYGLLQFVGILPHELFEGQNRPIGIYVEPDWLGMFSAIGLLLSFHVRRVGLRYTAATVNLVAVLLAGARAAWIALLAVALIGVLLARRVPAAERPRGAWRLTGFLLTSGAVLLAALPELTAFLVTRLEGVSSNELDVAANARQQQVDSLRHLESIAPWNGLGLSASGRVGVSGGITYIGHADNNVASNWVLGWWVDGKLLAVPLIALFVCAAAARANRISGRILLIILISSLFSNALYIPVAWLALGACLVSDRVRLDDDSDRGSLPGRVPSDVGAVHRNSTEKDDAALRGALMEERL